VTGKCKSEICGLGQFRDETEGCHGTEEMPQEDRRGAGLRDEGLVGHWGRGGGEGGEDVEIEADLDEGPSKGLEECELGTLVM
jgi:hypothetical protein